MNKRHFTFIDRYFEMEFFDENPVTITVCIGDVMDAKVDAIAKDALSSGKTFDDKVAVLKNLVGEENADAILAGFDNPDSYVVDQVLLFFRQTYVDEKQKNLVAAIKGRQNKD